MRHTALFRYLLAVSLLMLAGCSGASSPDSTTDTSGAGSNQAPAARVQPKPIVVPAGTTIAVTLDQRISTETNNGGDRFEASVAEPVMVAGKVAIPKGAAAFGRVTTSEQAGRLRGTALLVVDLDSVRVNGINVPVEVATVARESEGRGKRTAIGAGAGAAAGAVIGAIAGGGKGAAIGAGTGAGAGTAGAALTGERDVAIPAESRLNFRLTAPVEVMTQGT
jgi:hypothetical protein